MRRSYGKLSGTSIAASWLRLRLGYFVETHIMLLGFATVAHVLWLIAGMPPFRIIMIYWPKFLVHKAKQRLTKMTQIRIRMRKLALKTREKIMTTPRKEKKRESRRQEKAEKAALLDKSIEKELLERLSKGVYGDIYNYPKEKYEEILDREALQVASEEDDEELEVEYVEGYEDLEEEDDMEDFDGLGIRDSGLDDDTGMDDDNDDHDEEEAVAVHRKSGRKDSALARRRAEKDDPSAKSKKKAKVLVVVKTNNA